MSGVRKVHIKSFGCQMNVYDSHRMADTLAGEGYAEVATAGEADLIILNTCHIREKAAEKVYSELGRVNRLKQAAASDWITYPSSGFRRRSSVACCRSLPANHQARIGSAHADAMNSGAAVKRSKTSAPAATPIVCPR